MRVNQRRSYHRNGALSSRLDCAATTRLGWRDKLSLSDLTPDSEISPSPGPTSPQCPYQSTQLIRRNYIIASIVMASGGSEPIESSSPLESGWIKLVRRTGELETAAEELSVSPPSSSTGIMETTDRDIAEQATASSSSLLSSRGQKNSKFLSGPIKKVAAVFRDQYDSELNPNGIVVLGVADNALMRGELLKFFNTDRLHSTGPELTYGDRFFTSTRLITALCKLFNDTPVGLDKEKPKLIKTVTADDVVVGSGATGILDALFMMLCNPGEGVLLSVPYYNGFDHDLTARAEAKIVEVYTPLPEVLDPSKPKEPVQPSPAFTADTVKAYQTALDKAREEGTTVKALLICNPHVSGIKAPGSDGGLLAPFLNARNALPRFHPHRIPLASSIPARLSWLWPSLPQKRSCTLSSTRSTPAPSSTRQTSQIPLLPSLRPS